MGVSYAIIELPIVGLLVKMAAKENTVQASSHDHVKITAKLQNNHR